jgi:hypothetical protein
VYVSKHLSFDLVRRAVWGNAMAANRIREIRLSGMKWGAWGNVAYGGNVNPPRNRKGGSGNPLQLKEDAPQFYPNPFYNNYLAPHEVFYCAIRGALAI